VCVRVCVREKREIVCVHVYMCELWQYRYPDNDRHVPDNASVELPNVGASSLPSVGKEGLLDVRYAIGAGASRHGDLFKQTIVRRGCCCHVLGTD